MNDSPREQEAQLTNDAPVPVVELEHEELESVSGGLCGDYEGRPCSGDYE